MPKKYSPKAKHRYCPVCAKAFRPMTDKQWEVNNHIHSLTSLRHQKAIRQAQ